MRPRAAITVLVVLAALLAAVPAATAATFTVTSGGDAGDGTCDATCTLREAITAANASGQDHTIQFAVSTVSVPTALPEITSDGIFLDGCNKGRTPQGVAVGPDAAPCTEIRGTGSPTGFVIRDAASARVQGFFFTGFPGVAVHLWGTTSGWIRGNRFGQRKDGTAEANGRAIRVTGRTQNGATVSPAVSNVIGGNSAAADDQAACTFLCNMIVNSSLAGAASGIGIDLVGLAQGSGPGDAPAGGAPDDASQGTAIYGNWIGVSTAAGTPAPNEKGILVGAARQTTIGNENEANANVIAGNTEGGVDQDGTGAVALMRGLYGLSPDRDTAVGNGPFQARLHGSADTPAWVWDATFGPADVGLDLTGPGAELYGTWFTGPNIASSARFTTAAIRLGPDADGSFIGAPVTSGLIGGGPLVPNGCVPLFFTTIFSDACNAISEIAEGAAGVLIEGADNVKVTRTAVGAPLGGSDHVDGVPVRVRDSGSDPATAISIGSDQPNGWNDLWRQDGPAVEVGGNAQQVTILGNGGLSIAGPALAANRFTDLLPVAGPGNSGPVNGGISPPVITVSESDGVGGTATPGATVRVIEQERTPQPGDTDVPPEGTTFPATPAVATAGQDGRWGITFSSPLKEGQAVLASQTVNGNTSEFAAPSEIGPQPDPTVQITGGPTGLVSSRDATFTFTTTFQGVAFECSLDGADFSPCSTPKSYTGLESGGHQFRVRAVPAAGAAGPPASRNWTIELPAPTTAPGTTSPGTPSGTGGAAKGNGVAASATVRLTSVVTLPSAKRCVSRRLLKIRLKKPKGTGIAFVKIDVPGRATRTVRGKRLRAPVNLRGLPKGKFRVRLRITLLDGRVVKGSRTFRTCAPKPKRKRR